MPSRFGTDGIRGVANSELTPELALALGRAAARRLGGRTFVVGRDTRRSGPMLQACVAAGLASEGADVVDLGVIPTPGLAFVATDRRVPGVMISGSHNPFADNGIKIFSPSGSKLSDQLEEAIETDLANDRRGERRIEPPTGSAVGSITTDDSALESYVGHLLSLVEGIDLAGCHVVLDCANGAASAIAPEVLARAGAKTTVIEAAPDGVNINADCGATHTARVREAVLESGADLGLAFDGDADRVLAVDDGGNVVDGDQLIAMLAQDLDARGELSGHAVVVTVMSNLGLRRALSAASIAVIETPVGDRFVTDALEENGLALGGEQSGHIVFRRHATTGDGVLTGLILLELLVRKGSTLAELAAASMTRLPQVLESIVVPDPTRLGGASRVWAEVRLVEAELGSSGRVLLRPSGTEPLVRVMAEAATEADARRAVERLATVVRREIGDDRP
jgi:phosphoglucosamine mutase